jgi:hypothetical protein
MQQTTVVESVAGHRLELHCAAGRFDQHVQRTTIVNIMCSNRSAQWQSARLIHNTTVIVQEIDDNEVIMVSRGRLQNILESVGSCINALAHAENHSMAAADAFADRHGSHLLCTRSIVV